MQRGFEIFIIGLLSLTALPVSSSSRKSANKPCECTSRRALACGTDGKQYLNPCELECAQFKFPELQIRRIECEPIFTPSKATTCRCPRVKDKTCGSNGVVYKNACKLKCAQYEIRDLEEVQCTSRGRTTVHGRKKVNSVHSNPLLQGARQAAASPSNGNSVAAPHSNVSIGMTGRRINVKRNNGGARMIKAPRTSVIKARGHLITVDDSEEMMENDGTPHRSTPNLAGGNTVRNGDEGKFVSNSDSTRVGV